MAQRNPMNQRYQGDGPGGQTRKSAARAKPVTQAASSVHIRKKPQTDAEKRAARKAREKEEERKAAERARRKTERELAESAQAGKPVEREQPKGFFARLLAPPANMPSSEEYRKWRRLYWILLGVGILLVAFAFIIQMNLPSNPTLQMIALVSAYVPIIGALVVDFRKVKPLVKEHQKNRVGNKTPKQLKHEQEARERAEAIETARKAAREAKKPARRKKSDETIVPGDEQ